MKFMSKTKLEGGLHRFEYIDVARGIAILLVILVHTAWGASLFIPRVFAVAQMGVQLFFVSSAITLCFSAKSRGFQMVHQIIDFYIRRFFRIAPLYWVGIGLYCISTNLLSYFEDYHRFIFIGAYSLPNVLANIMLVHGLVPAANNNIVPGGWSIGTEILFYLVFPALWWALKDSYKRMVLGLIVSFILAVAQVILAKRNFVLPEGNSFIYFNLVNQLPVFIIGIITYRWLEERRNVWKSYSLIGILSWLFMVAIWRFYPISVCVVPFLSAISFSALVIFLSQLEFRNRSWIVIAYIGKYSYSMYIFHFIFSLYLTGCFSITVSRYLPGWIITVISYPFVVAFTYFLATLSYRFIEEPGILFGRRLIRKRNNRYLM